MGWNDDHPVLFEHFQSGPYQQELAINVQNHGNRLPITLSVKTGDPFTTSCHAMAVMNAEVLHRKLGEAIKTAKRAGL